MGVTKSLSRLLYWAANTNRFNKATNYGGWGETKDGDIVVEYYDGKSSDFNSSNSVDFEKSPKIFVHITKDGDVTASVFDGYGEKNYIVETVARQSNAHSASALLTGLIPYLFKQNHKGAQILHEHFSNLERAIVDQETADWFKWQRIVENDIYTIFNYCDELNSKCGYEFEVNNFSNTNIPFESYKDMMELDIQKIGRAHV